MYRPNDRPGGASPSRLHAERAHDFAASVPPHDEADSLDDAALVSHAAVTVAVSEFDLFRAAWHGWHGDHPREQATEAAFARFLQEGRAPAHVRHFARRVLDVEAAGGVARHDLGLTAYRRCEPLPDLSCRLSAEFLVCVLLALVVVAI